MVTIRMFLDWIDVSHRRKFLLRKTHIHNLNCKFLSLHGKINISLISWTGEHRRWISKMHVIQFKMSWECLRSDDDVVDGYMDELNEESNEAHNTKTNSSGDSNLLELATIRLGASFDESDRIFCESASWFVNFV